jgi:hypothetical protein
VIPARLLGQEATSWRFAPLVRVRATGAISRPGGLGRKLEQLQDLDLYRPAEFDGKVLRLRAGAAYLPTRPSSIARRLVCPHRRKTLWRVSVGGAYPSASAALAKARARLPNTGATASAP